MNTTPNKSYWRPDEVAELLGVSLDTIYRRIQDGTLEAVQIGKQYRILGESLAALLSRDKS